MVELTGNEVKITASYSRKYQLVEYKDGVEVGCYLTAIAKNKKVAPKLYEDLYKQCQEKVEAKILMELRIYKSLGDKFKKALLDDEIDIGQEDMLEGAVDFGDED